MRIVGIVAEYNPFHSGHKHQIEQSRRQLGENIGVVAVMSGNWIQQADCAIADKWVRSKLAIQGGADLVVELPTPWATASAETFCRGAVSLLERTGVVTHLSFGSEGGDISTLRQVANCLDSEEYSATLKAHLAQGHSFATARQRAVEELLGETGGLLARPNNTLGIEYLRSLTALNSSITPITVLRQGAAHNSVTQPDAEQLPLFTSATDVRQKLRADENWDYARRYLGAEGVELLQSQGVGLPNLQRCERAILAKIRTMTAEDWSRLPDSGHSEGLTNRLEQAGRIATSLGEFLNSVKTKRYTHARLRRLVLWAFLGLEEGNRPAQPPYLRVLACNDRGREMLRQMKTRAQLPIITKPSHAKDLAAGAREQFEFECRCTDLYALCFDPIRPAGLEWSTPASYRQTR